MHGLMANQDQEPFCDTEIKVIKQGLFGLSDLSGCIQVWDIPERSRVDGSDKGETGWIGSVGILHPQGLC